MLLNVRPRARLQEQAFQTFKWIVHELPSTQTSCSLMISAAHHNVDKHIVRGLRLARHVNLLNSQTDLAFHSVT